MLLSALTREEKQSLVRLSRSSGITSIPLDHEDLLIALGLLEQTGMGGLRLTAEGKAQARAVLAGG